MLKSLFILLSAVILAGCSTNPLNTINQNNFEKVDFTSNFKKGEACENHFLIFGPFGSSSVMDAAKSANIKTVEVVEQKITSYILFGNRCTIAYGK